MDGPSSMADMAAQWTPDATAGCRVGVLDPAAGLDQVDVWLADALATAGPHPTRTRTRIRTHIRTRMATRTRISAIATLTTHTVVDGVRQYALRGGEASRAWLHSLPDRGVDTVVVTAAPASVGSAAAVRADMARIGVADLFACTARDAAHGAAVAAAVAGYLAPTFDSPQSALLRTMTAFMLCSPRRGCDLHRVGRSNFALVDETTISFALAAPDGSTWSARQLITLSPDSAPVWDALQPATAVAIYLAHLDARGPPLMPAAAPVPDDRLFVRWHDSEGEPLLPFTSAGEMVSWLEEHLVGPAGLDAVVPPPVLKSLFWPDAAVINTVDDIGVASSGRLLCARYNKPEAVEAYVNAWRFPVPLTSAHPSPTPLEPDALPHVDTIIFVDDNSDNVVKMFLHFAAKHAHHLRHTPHHDPSAPRIISLLYPPPASGRAEASDPYFRALLDALVAGQLSTPQPAISSDRDPNHDHTPDPTPQ
ncbi:uncharacterized protein AMSG_04678 [Thecamonas trahens ATCC 50062]|uniref:Uncharacterized protein n=1 Tax=Thecamonas trahens ATCC 50062 TaxID=461836 RepID=A0A0L0DC97_THETB|nr:hypothetical protein AMSG_04678 [Thecamonas trahens ATCC 50062]KNC48933.1 hypothetical protein AMSG_04678 [Thecamonas trahens ATCC 50062]|eukprot:XP_013758350.1 hypothetical protein AMSG_04678 [Thecamonas trahens ATCC 50062]